MSKSKNFLDNMIQINLLKEKSLWVFCQLFSKCDRTQSETDKDFPKVPAGVKYIVYSKGMCPSVSLEGHM